LNKLLARRVAEGKAVIEKTVSAPDMSRKFRMNDSMDNATQELIWDMVSRHAREAALKKEAIWAEVAKMFGYDSMEEAHAANLSFEIDYVEKTIMMVKDISGAP
jgi:hypothetical protein